jgi:hypothetical protein
MRVRLSIWLLDPRAHGEEGGAGAAHLLGAGGAERALPALAERVGRCGEFADRAHLIAQEGDRHRHQKHRRREGEHQQLVGVRGDHPAALDLRGQHALVGEDARVDELVVGDEVDGQRADHLGLEGLLHHAAGEIVEAAQRLGRGRLLRCEPQGHAERRRDLGQPRLGGRRVLRRFDQPDRKVQLLRDGAGHLARHAVVMALDERQRDHALQQQHRQQQDHQRAAEQGFGQKPLDGDPSSPRRVPGVRSLR